MVRSFPFSAGGWGGHIFFFRPSASLPFPATSFEPRLQERKGKQPHWRRRNGQRALTGKEPCGKLPDTIWPVEELESSSRLCVNPSALLLVPNTSAINTSLTSGVAIFPQGSASAEGSLPPYPGEEEQRAEWLEPPSPKPPVDRDPGPPRQADDYQQFTTRNFPPGLSWWSSG